MRGFSLVELLVVLGITAVIGSVVMTGYGGMRAGREPRDAATSYALALAEAAGRARTMQLNSAWGVRVLPGKIVTFKGASYAARDVAQDRTVPTGASLSTGGPAEVVFAKFTGLPGATGTTTFSNAYASSTVSVLASGAVRFPL